MSLSSLNPIDLSVGLCAQLEEGLFCDVRIVCSDGHVRMHRPILAAASKFLHGVLVEEENRHDHDHDGGTVMLLPDFGVHELSSATAFLYGKTTVAEGDLSTDVLNCLGMGRWTFANAAKSATSWSFKVEPRDQTDVNFYEDPFDYIVDAFDQECSPENEDDESTQLVDDFTSAGLKEGSNKSGRGRKRRFEVLEDGRWRCLECNVICRRKYLVKRHFDSAHRNEQRQQTSAKRPKKEPPPPQRYCPKCLVSFKSEDELKGHDCEGLSDEDERSKHVETSSSTTVHCNGCQRPFENTRFLRLHLDRAKKSCREAHHVCSECALIFDTKAQLDEHSLQHRGEFTCDTCGQSLDGWQKYLKHLSIAHRAATGTGASVAASHKCARCAEVFPELGALLAHMRKVHDENEGTAGQQICSFCGRTFSSKSSLALHIEERHVVNALSCPRCPRSFKSARGLKYHLALHDGAADYLCHDCGRGFVTAQKLANHRRAVHTLEKPYICDQCGRAFFRSDKLAVHRRRVHTGERPYACTQCDWRGVDSSSLIHHKKRHDGNKKSASSPRKKPVDKQDGQQQVDPLAAAPFAPNFVPQ